MISKLKTRLIFWLARHLLPLTEDKDIISFAKKGKETIVFLDGEQLAQQEIIGLKNECRFLEESLIWKLMNKYPTAMAKKKLFTDSKDITDILFAKTMLYTLEVQENIKKNIEKI
jgi:hypothetical protein